MLAYKKNEKGILIQHSKVARNVPLAAWYICPLLCDAATLQKVSHGLDANPFCLRAVMQALPSGNCAIGKRQTWLKAAQTEADNKVDNGLSGRHTQQSLCNVQWQRKHISAQTHYCDGMHVCTDYTRPRCKLSSERVLGEWSQNPC